MRLSMPSVAGSAYAVSRALDDSQHECHFTSRFIADVYGTAGYKIRGTTKHTELCDPASGSARGSHEWSSEPPEDQIGANKIPGFLGPSKEQDCTEKNGRKAPE